MSYVTELIDTLRDSKIGGADRQAVLKSLQDLADSGNQEAKAAVATIEPTDSANAGSNDSEGRDPIESGAVKAMVLMGLSDEAQARAGYPPFDYGDKEVEALCKLWHEAYRRAKAGDLLFRGLFEQELTLHDRTVLALN